MQADLKVGASPVSDGALIPGRATKDSSFGVQDSHARYQEAVYRGGVFIGANTAAVTTQAGLSATTPALVLYNPVGSGKLGVLLEVTVALSAAPAAASYAMLAVNLPTAAAPTSVTAATMQNAYTSNLGQPTLQAYRVSTLPTAPVAIRYANMATAASAVTPGQIFGEIAGSIIVGPGVSLSLQTQTAASVIATFTWEEIAV